VRVCQLDEHHSLGHGNESGSRVPATAVGFAFLSVEGIPGHDSVSAIFTGLATLGFASLAVLEFRTQGVSREDEESRLRRELLRTFAKRGR
jgi:hypothetical protein